MTEAKEICVDCKQEFTRLNPDIAHWRCPQCQAKFRAEEAEGLHPATMQSWLDKIEPLTTGENYEM